MKQTKDTRYVYGFCTWHDSIANIGLTSGAIAPLPCCPHCGSMLMEFQTPEDWWDGVKRYDATHPGYEAMIRWGQGKCFPDVPTLREEYTKATGIPAPPL